MDQALQITFKDVSSSPAVEARIREEVEELERVYDHIIGCRVVVELPHRHQRQGSLYGERIDLTLPGREIVVGREPTQHQAHEDVFVAIRDAFDAAKRQLQDHARRERRQTKHHESPGEGFVARIFREGGYGFLETADAREIYFHKNSVVDGKFDTLEVGTRVRFTEELGEKGPQATIVHPGRQSGGANRGTGARQ